MILFQQALFKGLNHNKTMFKSISTLLFILLFTNTSFAQKKHVFNLSLLKQEAPLLNQNIIKNTDVVSHSQLSTRFY